MTLEQIEAFEEAVGKRQAIVASSGCWGEQSFPLHNLEIITRHNAIPLIYWSPWDKPYVMEREDLIGLPRRHTLPENGTPISIPGPGQAKSFGRPDLCRLGTRE